MLITLLDSFIPVPLAVKKVQNATVMEGRDLTKECKVTTGTPPVTVFWEDVNSGQIIDGKLLIITNIARYQTEYKCIDVQCKNLQHFYTPIFLLFNEALVTCYYNNNGAESHFYYDEKF